MICMRIFNCGRAPLIYNARHVGTGCGRTRDPAYATGRCWHACCSSALSIPGCLARCRAGPIVQGAQSARERSRLPASAPSTSRPAKASLALPKALKRCGGVFLAIALISGVVNLLALSGSFYMLQVYDRVLTSHSTPTLIALSVLVAGLYIFQSVIDLLRSQVLVRLGSGINAIMMPAAHAAALELPLRGQSATSSLQSMRDVDAIRAFLAGQGLVALFDMPWIPVYLIFVYMLHPILGLLATGGMVVLIVLTLMTEFMTQSLEVSVGKAASTRMALADANARNADILRAMGFGDRATDRFLKASTEYLMLQAKASDVVGGMSSLSKVFRMMMQSAMLGVGAYLTLMGEVTGGAIMASSICTGRATAPVELAISQWKSFVSARQSYARLKKTLAAMPANAPQTKLPPPKKSFTVENVALAAPGGQRLLVSGVTFQLEAGQGLGIIGPSGAGKSTLARALTGVWPLARGAVRLDGAALDQWQPSDLGAHMGYLPQDVSLFDGTIADNISRMDPEADSRAIITAAKAADVHQLILGLSDGYDTRLGVGGTSLSGGQRQRIALARALYKSPFLVVLDEPNSNLDAEGEAALTRAIHGIRERGGIAIVIAHRPSALAAVDKVAVLGGGQLAAFGPKEEVLGKVLSQAGAPGAAPAQITPQALGQMQAHMTAKSA